MKWSQSKLKDFCIYPPISFPFMKKRNSLPKGLWEKYENNPQYKLADPDCWLGIEIEVEKIGNAVWAEATGTGLDFWNLTNDNSLKDSGIEFVSIPMKDCAIPIALSSLETWLKDVCPKHSFSARCGTHIHVNCRYMTLEQLSRFVLLYLIVENIFFKEAGTTRAQSNFCVPLADCAYNMKLPQIFLEIFQENEKGILDIIKHSWKKYAAFNLRPLLDAGTIEFRHYPGTCSTSYLMKQINLIQSLRRFAITNSTDTIKRWILELNNLSTYSMFVENVLGISDAYSPTELRLLMEDRVALAKAIITFPEFAKKTSVNFEASPLVKYSNVRIENSLNKSRSSQIAHKIITSFDKVSDEVSANTLNELLSHLDHTTSKAILEKGIAF